MPEDTWNQPTRSTAFRVVLSVLFSAIAAVQIAKHVLWIDEINVLAIDRASHTIGQLWWICRHEGHPFLWYLVTWLMTCISGSIGAFKFLQMMVATGICFVLGMKAPFNRVTLILCFLSYYILFEYTVLARTYGLTVLLLLIYIWKRSEQPERWTRNAILLGLVANTDMIGILLTFGLALEYAWDQWPIYREQGMRFGKAALALGSYGALAIAGILYAHPAKDTSWRTTAHPMQFAHSLLHLEATFVHYTVGVMIPITYWDYPKAFWNPDPLVGPKRYAMAVIILVLLWLSVRASRILTVSLLAVWVMGFLFGHLIYSGSTRHVGMIALMLLSCIWILGARGRQPNWAAMILLVLMAGSGLAAVYANSRHPFSDSLETANWLRAHGLANNPMTGFNDYNVATVAEELNRPVYFLECRCTDTFLYFQNRRDNFVRSELPTRLYDYIGQNPTQKTVFVGTDPLTPGDEHVLKSLGVRIEPLAELNDAEVDRYFVYALTRPAMIGAPAHR
jgi:hypothetical protein